MPVQKQQKIKEPENDTDVSNSINEPKVIETTFMHNDTMNSTISRFGRNCRPPLKYWQGERVLHIGDQTIYQPPNLNDDIKKLDASTRSSKSVKVNSASVQKRKVEASTKEEKYETKLSKKEKKEQGKKSQVKNADNINTQKLNTSPKRQKGRASKSEAKSKISEFLMNNRKLVKRNYSGNDIISNDKLKKLKELRICLTDILVEKLAEDLESKGKPEAKKRRISVRSSRVLSSRYPKNYNLRQIRNKVKNKKKNLNKSESVDSGYVCSPVFGKNKMCYVLLERMNSSLQSKKPEQKKHDITRVISKNIEKRVKKNINRKKQLKKILSATDLQMLIMKKRRSLNAKAVFVQQSKNKIDEMETDSQVTSPVTSQSSDETILRIPKKRKLYNESEWMAEIAEMDIN